jgi:hypothetical protein
MIPMFLFIPIPFVFVLLVLLLKKTPKVGVWAVGGLISFVGFVFMILLPVGMHRGLMPVVLPDGGEIPFFVIPLPFLFVLLILLLNKAPKVGAAVIVGVVVMGLLGTVLWLGVSHRPVAYDQTIEGPAGSVHVTQQTLPGRGHGGLDALKSLHIDVPQPPEPPVGVTLPDLRGPAVMSPIWSEGVENEYEADVYPSKLAAVRALGGRMRRPIQEAIVRIDGAAEIVVFQEEHDRSLVMEFKDAIEKALPEVPCSIAAGTRNIDWNEIGITLRFAGLRAEPGPWVPSGSEQIPASDVYANARNRDWEANVKQSFIEKPWVENYAGFASEGPQRHFLIARSWEACTSENEARQQAIRDACNQLSAITGKKWTPVPGADPLTVSSQDLQEGSFIADQFVQSFDASAGKIWRQAMLIDASAEKLAWLNDRKTVEMHAEMATWARMILSAFGVLVVIVAAYLFLNMATKGYYEWSLRIAGMVLAIAGILSIFLVLR